MRISAAPLASRIAARCDREATYGIGATNGGRQTGVTSIPRASRNRLPRPATAHAQRTAITRGAERERRLQRWRAGQPRAFRQSAGVFTPYDFRFLRALVARVLVARGLRLPGRAAFFLPTARRAACGVAVRPLISSNVSLSATSCTSSVAGTPIT